MPRVRKVGPHMTEGAVDLRHYLDRNGLSVPRFCEQFGLSRIQVQRMLNGERQRISLNFAADIERVTCGAVKMARWNEPASTLQATGTDSR